MSKFIHINDTIQTVKAPTSKSIGQRVLFAAALANTSSKILGINQSDDVQNILKIITQLGAEIIWENEQITILPKKGKIAYELSVGESGLGTRLSVPIVSHFNKNYTITGTGTLLNRPMHWFKKYLPEMGLKVQLNNNYLPIQVEGKLKGGNYTVDGNLSSQYISGLLMALPLCAEDSVLQVENAVSTPYIDITIAVLAKYGISIQNNDYLSYHIKGKQTYTPPLNTFTIEGDFSGAACWIVYGLLSKNGITIENLNPNSTQADIAILKVVHLVGGKIKWENNTLKIIPPEVLKPFEFNAENCPDLFPVLASLAAGIQGKSTIFGTERLRYKESDRATVLIEEFAKLGLTIKAGDNVLKIYGEGNLNSGQINSHKDHRIAMAFAIASLLTPHGLYITDPECVNKSYPNFWEATIVNLKP
ncbi:3-phosphoshikimate 1-carboxyvinyltransferase [Putridiphycobacter roseus]|uniref:3-phosphoshikimate 1-carboxyvinyltransferase n=1 Tax=Putridiphycobacter roseus TaxID=2219161 RepID=UPI001314B82F|nr:3-phosphoshikimate 1-carboxyvinyltransferase [Putridiphycobacter roseus]